MHYYLKHSRKDANKFGEDNIIHRMSTSVLEFGHLRVTRYFGLKCVPQNLYSKS